MSRMQHRRRHGKAKIAPLCVLEGNQKPDPGDVKEMGTGKKDWKWQRGITTHSMSESKYTKSHLSVQK